MRLILAICMLGAAVVASMLGQGGGTLYTPLQVLLGVNFHQAATTSLFLIIVMSVSASLVFHKARKIDWLLAIVLEVATAAGGFVGGLCSAGFSGATLSVVFAVVVAAAAVFMIRPMKERQPYFSREGGFFSWKRTQDGQTYYVNLALALPLSLGAGIASGMLGIGGGVFKVPMMVLALGIPIDIAIGSSALMVGLTAGGGFAGHLLSGHWDWRISLILAGAVFVGAQVGSRLTIKMDNTRLKKALGWFLVFIAVTMVFKAICS
jgi:uncharacterized membrane protein YfcA